MKRRIPRAPRSWAAKRGLLSFVVGLVGLALLLVPRLARADDPELSATVDTKKLGVGEVLRLTLHVSSRQHQPEAPNPGPTPGFSVVGSSSGPSQEVTISGGRVVVQRGLDAAWSLRAEKVGTWSIGPVTVKVGGSTYRVGPVQIVVVPAGQGPKRAPDPLDPFGGPFDPFRGLLDSLGGQQRHDLPGEDPKLALDAPRGTVAFLHATIDKTDVVVGEQVTVAMYLYVDVTTRDPGMVDIHEATAADFVKKTLFEDDNNDRAASRAVVGDRVYNVRLLRKWALFPIRTGDLVVSPMEMTLQKNRSTGDPSRKSELLTVHVTEPPMAHRPPGYTLGDVGKFSLSAETTPREIEEDGAVGVTLTLEGQGNLPAMVTPPAQAGLEWLAPEVHEKLGPMQGAGQGDIFGGTRTFTYVLRIHKAGDLRLGSISVPFWDPATKRYDVARADLGTVTVRPSKTTKAQKDAPPDPFSTLPDVRPRMGLTRGAASNLAETHPTLFWLALGAAPIGFVVFTAVSSVVRRTRERIRERALSPETDLKAKLLAAERAARGDDARSLSAATARALEAATLVYAEVNVRDARADEARGRLVDAGLSEALAAEVGSVLHECEEARFSPEPPELSLARGRWEKARGAIQAMRREA
jgi:hypothetical protein